LYELLLTQVVGVGVATSPKSPSARLLPSGAIEPVGFELHQGLVDYPPQSFVGYRLLSEYFAFPQKFLFFDVHLNGTFAKQQGSQLELYFYLKERWQDLEPHIQADSVQLNATPIVNLFSKRAEPIRLTHFDASYTITPDARRPVAHEVYSIDSVDAISSDGEQLEFLPFYSFRHVHEKNSRAFWHATRRVLKSDKEIEFGHELDISFVDLEFNPLEPGSWTIDIETTCTNRNLPSHMPFGGGQPFLQLEVGGAVDRVVCLTKPTPAFRPPIGQALRWKAVSHLSLNHLSLVDDELGATALRELLKVYDFRMDEITANSIIGLINAQSKPILGRIPGDRSGGMCRGLQTTLTFDESKYSAGNMYLFASILDRFLALYCNINSFNQTSALTSKRKGVQYRWPARGGLQRIL
ncbi:MAG: type VI secretion system baseplate subunit TssF, partial [Planctomycetales bacterium]|nr:type VI secretion system baseplate subunit TssF [Planctomycetales bacterium]